MHVMNLCEECKNELIEENRKTKKLCKSCFNKIRNRKRSKESRQKDLERTLKIKSKLTEEVNKIKSAGCSICGYNKCFKALTFHHLDSSTKKETISNLICSCKKLEVILEEIKKCILVCQNCHHEIHDKNKTFGKNKKHMI